MPLTPTPAPSPLASFWQLDRKLDRHRSTQQLPATADIVIIGGGFAGASIAHHLLSKSESAQTRPCVVILEARDACSGATGRNGGHLKPDPYNRAYQVLGSHGPAEAEKLTQFEGSNLDAVGELVKSENIDCDFVRTLAYDVFFREEDWAAALAKVNSLRRAGVQSALDLIISASSEEAERTSHVKGAKGCFSYATGHLSPYKLVLSLLEKAVARGVNLQTHTPVTAVQRASESAAENWLVFTPRGEILANTVIHASNGYASALVPELRGKIVPARGICCRIVPKNPTVWSDRSYMLRHNDWEYDYLISRKDGSIIVGGAKRDFYKDLDAWFNNSDDTTLIESSKGYFDGYMQRTFKGWDDSLASVDKIWTGIMGYSNDGCPYVGEIPDRSGQYVCAGFSGHGMPQTFLAAEAVASMVVDGKEFEETELPSLFKISSDRLESKSEHTSLVGWKAVMQRSGPKL